MNRIKFDERLQSISGTFYSLLIIAVAVNMAITEYIDRFSHPQLTETQLFMRLVKVFFWDFTL